VRACVNHVYTCAVRKKALIFGVTGQDGSYLSELLLSKDYEVHGVIRRASNFNTSRIDHLLEKAKTGTPFVLHYGDMLDGSSINSLLSRIKPCEIYNLAAQSHVKVSFEIPEFTAQTDAIGTLRLLEALRWVDYPVRYYQASSSEMFGKVAETPQSESTPFRPQSPYAISKVFAHEMTKLYREAYLLHASNGILFNHESPRRGNTFVTHKVTRGVADIVARRSNKLVMGNLLARRDWGYAPEYVDAMWRMLQQDQPGDYVVATGEMHSVEELCKTAFQLVGLNWKDYVESDARYYRPAEVDELCGNASKAKQVLGWEPNVKFAELVKIMLEADMGERLP
jgi:GDPmannose 4,6-dehydratase